MTSNRTRTPHDDGYAKLLGSDLEQRLKSLFKERTVGGAEIRLSKLETQAPPIGEREARAKRWTWTRTVSLDLELYRGRDSVALRTIMLQLPCMTARGTFLLAGREYAPLVQLVPRPGLSVRSSTTATGMERIARAEIIPERGPALTFTKSLKLRGPSEGRATRVRLNVQGSPEASWGQAAKDLQKALGSSPRAADLPVLGNEGREALNATVASMLGASGSETSELLTAADIANVEKCLAVALRLPPDDEVPTEQALRAALAATAVEQSWGPQPSDLRATRALTIGDQVGRALEDSLVAAVNSASAALHEKAAKTSPGATVSATPALARVGAIVEAALGAFTAAALSVDARARGRARAWPTTHRVLAPFTDPRIIQPLDLTNPLAEHSHLRKVTRRGPGGVNARYGAAAGRDLHDSHHGALCPFETPESQYIGLNLHLARGAKVANGEIAASDANDGWLGGAASLIPFLAHDDAARALMGAKNMKQAVPLLKAEAPLILTGHEAPLAAEAGAVVRSAMDGTVSSVSHDDTTGVLRIVTTSSDGRGAPITREETLRSLAPTDAGTLSGLEPRVAAGDSVTAGHVLAAHPAVAGDALALGVNLRVAFMPFKGLNFEDGIVISERLVRDSVLTSRHRHRVRIELRENEILWLGRQGPDGAPRPDPLDERGIVRLGSTVRVGDELARSYTVARPGPGAKESYSARTRRAQAGQCGRVIHVERRDAGPHVDVEIWLEETRAVRIGDKLMGRHGNKGVVTAILPDEEMPCIPDIGPVDVVLNPIGLLNRKNLGQLAETHVAWLLRHAPEHVKEQIPATFPATSPLDGGELARWQASAGIPGGKLRVTLGRHGGLTTGAVVVGYQYFMKLNHLADDKEVFRAAGGSGSYGVVTKQPNRGRRGRGGQRLGEMETWALDAWDVQSVFEECRGLKSDDTSRREVLHEAIAGGTIPAAGGLASGRVTESWFVLQTLLLGLGLEVRLELEDGTEVGADPGPERRPPVAAVRAFRSSLVGDERLSDLANERRPAPANELERAFRSDRPRVWTSSRQSSVVEWKRLECGCAGDFDQIVVKGKGKWRCREHERPASGTDVIAEHVARVPVRGGLGDPGIWGFEDDDRHGSTIGYIELPFPIPHPLTADLALESPLFTTRIPVLPRRFRPPSSGIDNRLYRPLLRAIEAFDAELQERVAEALQECAPPTAELANELAQACTKISTDAEAARWLESRGLSPKRWLTPKTADGARGLLAALRAADVATLAKGMRRDMDRLAAAFLKEARSTDGNVTITQWLTARSLRAQEFTIAAGIPSDATLDAVAAAWRDEQSDARNAILAAVARLRDGLIKLIGTKRGFIRSRMLGKRMELSGRAVIIGDPSLKMDECGIPLDFAVELLRQPLEDALEITLTRAIRASPELDRHRAAAEAPSPKRATRSKLKAPAKPSASAEKDGRGLARKLLATATTPEGEELLASWLGRHGVDPGAFAGACPDETLASLARRWSQGRLTDGNVKLLLNRQPTLHRYGIMAFHPRVRTDSVIAISPLVCGAFNADFDGDTMAAHVPATHAAQKLAWERMRPSANPRSAAAGQPLVHVVHEILAGWSCLWAREREKLPDSWSAGSRPETADALRAWCSEEAANAELALHAGLDAATRAAPSVAWSDLTALASRLEVEPRDTARLEGSVGAWLAEPEATAEDDLALLAASGAVRKPANTLTQIAGSLGSFETLSGGNTSFAQGNLLRGLTPIEMFAACRGARKTLAEKKLLTPRAGTLTRLLVWAAGSTRITRDDCGATTGIRTRALSKDGKAILPLDRWTRQRSHVTGTATTATAATTEGEAIIRSPLTCKERGKGGLCSRCYGADLQSGGVVPVGFAAGLVAATSIGERGTQLAMTTFHSGGQAGQNVMSGFSRVCSVLAGQPVVVHLRGTTDDWTAVATTGTTEGPTRGTTLRSLRDLPADPPDDLLRILLFEMYDGNYKHDEVDPRHFEVLLAALLRSDATPASEASSTHFLGVQAAAMQQPTRLERLGFGYAREVMSEWAEALLAQHRSARPAEGDAPPRQAGDREALTTMGRLRLLGGR